MPTTDLYIFYQYGLHLMRNSRRGVVNFAASEFLEKWIFFFNDASLFSSLIFIPGSAGQTTKVLMAYQLTCSTDFLSYQRRRTAKRKLVKSWRSGKIQMDIGKSFARSIRLWKCEMWQNVLRWREVECVQNLSAVWRSKLVRDHWAEVQPWFIHQSQIAQPIF